MSPEYRRLTEDDVAHFKKYGFIKISKCISPTVLAEWTSDVWSRLQMSATDKSIWTKERTYLPATRSEDLRTISPKAWEAICDLLGGEERISKRFMHWQDGFIVNLGTEAWENRSFTSSDLDNWHVDGNFFNHFLDSPEQALLVIPFFTDIVPAGGGTFVCSDSIPGIAKHLYDHPEGVTPRMVPCSGAATESDDNFYPKLISTCQTFYELTGNAGDVVLMHPFMVHSASRNSLRKLRLITNPPVALKEPFNYSRVDESSYSLVELKTMQALGETSLSTWQRKASP